jgi:hypothetical protein
MAKAAAAIKATPPSLGASLIIQYYPSVVAATLSATTAVISAAAAVKLSLKGLICRNGGGYGGSGVWRAQI